MVTSEVEVRGVLMFFRSVMELCRGALELVRTLFWRKKRDFLAFPKFPHSAAMTLITGEVLVTALG